MFSNFRSNDPESTMNLGFDKFKEKDFDKNFKERHKHVFNSEEYYKFSSLIKENDFENPDKNLKLLVYQLINIRAITIIGLDEVQKKISSLSENIKKKYDIPEYDYSDSNLPTKFLKEKLEDAKWYYLFLLSLAEDKDIDVNIQEEHKFSRESKKAFTEIQLIEEKMEKLHKTTPHKYIEASEKISNSLIPPMLEQKNLTLKSDLFIPKDIYEDVFNKKDQQLLLENRKSTKSSKFDKLSTAESDDSDNFSNRSLKNNQVGHRYKRESFSAPQLNALQLNNRRTVERRSAPLFDRPLSPYTKDSGKEMSRGLNGGQVLNNRSKGRTLREFNEELDKKSSGTKEETVRILKEGLDNGFNNLNEIGNGLNGKGRIEGLSREAVIPSGNYEYDSDTDFTTGTGWMESSRISRESENMLRKSTGKKPCHSKKEREKEDCDTSDSELEAFTTPKMSPGTLDGFISGKSTDSHGFPTKGEDTKSIKNKLSSSTLPKVSNC